MTHINIVKRNGTSEPLNIDKIHKVVMHACEGLAGVSASQIEMNSNLQFYDGMTTEEIQEILDLASEERFISGDTVEISQFDEDAVMEAIKETSENDDDTFVFEFDDEISNND